MSYSEFTNLTLVKKQFNLVLDETHNLFATVSEITISEKLAETLSENVPLALAIATEKARFELIIAPILVELRKLVHHQISLFSGVEFTMNEEKGLKGICDFIITRSPEMFTINAPVVMLVEAKNENIKYGLGQCLAEMIAAQEFNHREESDISQVYGVVTTGNLWKFLVLENNRVMIDLPEYHISQAGKILSVLLTMVSL